MKPEAFLPSNFLRLGAASVVPATPIAAGPVAGARRVAPKAAPNPAEFIEWADNFLRTNRTASREDRLKVMNLRHKFQLQLEAAELAANPAAREELRLLAERLARKAQSGFSPPPPPALLSSEGCE